MDLALNAPILLDFDPPDENIALRTVADLLAGQPAMADYEAFWSAVWERQLLQPPLLGNGLALPHARTSAVTEILFAIGRCRQPVPFGGGKVPVRLIFLYGAPPGQVAQSLATVAMLVRKLQRPEILSGLLEAGTEAEFRKWLA
jgi:mannitol/fructose-specific phosphotransferase system IIA component (Ntr-type)